MAKSRFFVCLVCVAALAQGCGGKPTLQSLSKDFIKISNEFADILATVNDQASADAAKVKIEALAKRTAMIKKQMDELEKSPQLTQKEKEDATKEMMEGMKASGDKLMQVMKTKTDKMNLLAPLLREFATFGSPEKSK